MPKKVYRINAGAFQTRCQTHRLMKEIFSDCEYYGNSLDALHDVLTSIGEDATVEIRGIAQAKEALGGYADRLCRVFADAAGENPHLTVLYPKD